MSNIRAPKRSSPCPCQSGSTYGECCQPYHRGEKQPPTPEALMRSRYAAFATGDVDYLVKTLHPDHRDRQLPAEMLVSSLRSACREQRYTGLEVFEASEDGDKGHVRFRARVFQKGRDLSFSETSRFERIDGAWRYLDGETE